MTARKEKQQRWLAEKARQVDVDALLRRGWIKSEAELPEEAVLVNPDKIVITCPGAARRLFYDDMSFECVECGVAQVWLARSQKWYCEVVKGAFESLPKRCRECRRKDCETKRLARIALGLDALGDPAQDVPPPPQTPS